MDSPHDSANLASVWEHIGDLRKRILIALGVVVFGIIVTHIFHQEIISFLLRSAGEQELIFLSPLDPLLFILKIDFIGGIIVAFPIIIWGLMSYVSPALPKNINRYFSIFYILSTILLASGLCYALFVTIPLSLKFLFSIVIPGIESQITAQSYISFFIGQALIMMIIFQMPIIIIGAINIGFFTTKFLAKKRRVIYLILTIALAIITPTVDIFNLCVVLLPCIMIFELSLLGQKAIEVFKKKA